MFIDWQRHYTDWQRKVDPTIERGCLIIQDLWAITSICGGYTHACLTIAPDYSHSFL